MGVVAIYDWLSGQMLDWGVFVVGVKRKAILSLVSWLERAEMVDLATNQGLRWKGFLPNDHFICLVGIVSFFKHFYFKTSSFVSWRVPLSNLITVDHFGFEIDKIFLFGNTQAGIYLFCPHRRSFFDVSYFFLQVSQSTLDILWFWCLSSGWFQFKAERRNDVLHIIRWTGMFRWGVKENRILLIVQFDNWFFPHQHKIIVRMANYECPLLEDVGRAHL